MNQYFVDMLELDRRALDGYTKTGPLRLRADHRHNSKLRVSDISSEGGLIPNLGDPGQPDSDKNISR